ncbi:hypothetical protein PHMEG_00020346 [Phytophthora megakarya]|uniref:Reverse transcriptase n=1 Tax=Phytophthora megakarya TaxID=4795 RepID=A0A225VRY6_9STRA|nr:hypothetical protein PHMEG_00020346 [Phytophthora megakarya]
MTPITERSVSFDDSVDYSDAKEDDEEDFLEEKAPVSELSEGAVLSVGHSAGVKALARNSPENGKNETAVGGWEGNFSVNRFSTSNQQRFPSDAALDDWAPADAGTALRKRKKKLRATFGVEEIAPGGQVVARQAFMPADPSQVPLPQTPVKQNESSTGGSKGSPYMHHSHMVTSRSASRQDRVVKDNEASRLTSNVYKGPAQQSDRRYDLIEDSSDNGNDLLDVDYLEGDLTEEWTHRTWKLLRDTFIKYYCAKFNQSAKARYYSAKREDKEHVCDNLHRFNGYARNTGVQFENCGGEAKDHVEHFLDTCDDRGLEERLCHVWVKDIHDLEVMINDILKRRDRITKRDSSVRRSSGQDGGYRRDSSRNEDSRSSYRRDNHYRDDHRRDELPRVAVSTENSLADASSDLVTALNETSVGPQTRQSGSYDHGYEANEDSFGDEERLDDEGRYSNRGSEYDYAGEDDRGHVAAANDHERRAAPEGTFARSDNRRPKGDGHSNNDRGFTRDNRNGRRQYGPYEASMMLESVTPSTNSLASSGRKLTKNDLTPILEIVLAEHEVDADYLFACAAEVKWPEDREMGFVNTTEIVEGNDGSLDENEADKLAVEEYGGYLTEASASGERLVWWSSQRYDKRKRMRAVVMGAIDDTRTRILAGVDVVLGTDFMIPADVVFDLFHGTARLPDEVTMPLVKSAGAADDEPNGVLVVGGVTEDLYVPRDGDGNPQGHACVGPLDERVGWDSPVLQAFLCGPMDTAKESSHVKWDDTLLQKEKDLYECCEANKGLGGAQKFMLDHPESDDRGDGASYRYSVKTYDDSEASVAAGLDEEIDGKPDTRATEFSDAGDDKIDPAEDSGDMLELTYISVIQAIEAEIASDYRSDDDALCEHIPNEMELAGYAHELAFLPDLTEPSSTVLDYTGPNVTNETYGVVCGIDVQGHMPIKQRALWTPLRVLEKLYELLKGLLRAGLITFSDSPWASPIVIVLKTNGVDIRLCIDYKRVNAVTTIMEYAMPLVDALLTAMEGY